MKPEIRVKHGDIQKIADLIGKSHLSVSRYLRGSVYSKSADSAREIAISRFGGVEVTTLEK